MTIHTPESLAALARGFMETRVFLTAAELDLFTLLAEGPLSLEEVVAAREADPRGLEILLDALAAMGLLEKSDGRWRTAPGLIPFLSSRGERSLLPLALHSVNLWDRWSRLTEVVAGSRPGAGDRDAWTRSFIGAMHAIAEPQADGLVAVVEPGAARRLLDVGGGPATYTLAFVKAVPGLTATLFDLPAVVELARGNVAAAGLLDRVDLVAGDLRTDALRSPLRREHARRDGGGRHVHARGNRLVARGSRLREATPDALRRADGRACRGVPALNGRANGRTTRSGPRPDGSLLRVRSHALRRLRSARAG